MQKRDLTALARRGAQIRLKELQEEMDELALYLDGSAAQEAEEPTPTGRKARSASGRRKVRKARRPMSQRQRAQIRRKVKAYWAKKKAGEA